MKQNMIDEIIYLRTCEMIAGDYNSYVTFYKCSECNKYIATRMPPKFCPECGTKVSKIDNGNAQRIE